MRAVLARLLPFFCIPGLAQSEPHTVYIIIHGTWCAPFSWHMPGGDFYDALKSCAHQYDAAVAFLNWSGKNNHEARVSAAQRLIRLINTYPENSCIHLVAHSHGGNVGILASQLLASDPENHYRIQQFFAFGTPINRDYYMPAMDMIDRFYNFFSYGDMIQTVFGLYQRELPCHERIINIRIKTHNAHPGHSDLHDPLVASWIPYLDLKLDGCKPYLATFQEHMPPSFVVDNERQKFITLDTALRSIVRKKIIHLYD